MKLRTRRVLGWTLVFAVGMAAGGLFLPLTRSGAIDWPFGEKKKAQEPDTAEKVESAAPRTALPNGALPSFVDLAKQLTPCVVNISTTKEVRPRTRVRRFPGAPGGPRGRGDPFEDFFEQFNRFFGEQGPHAFRQNALGSGFIMSKDGYIITNNHVVDEADDIKVVLSDKKDYPAKIVGVDPKSDLALIKIEAKEDLPTAALGDSSGLEIGEWVVAIGNPFGLSHTVTAGIVSAKGRVIGAGPYDDFIQTDASINPGNSGGPLFNLKGEVVGINTAIIQNAQGIGFATPINIAKSVVAQLKDKGKVVRGWLGVGIQDIDPDAKQFFGVEEAKGALVTQVMDGSPAEKAGIKRDDVIVKFNDKDIQGAQDLPLTVASLPVGSDAEVEVLRKGKSHTFTVTIGELKDEEQAKAESGGGSKEEIDEKLGLAVETLTAEIADQVGVDAKTQGVVVTGVDGGGAAAQAGIRRGDVITEVNRIEVADRDAFYAALDKSKVDEEKKTRTALFLVLRGDGSRYAAVKTPID